MRRVIAAVAAVGLLTACGGSKPGSSAPASTAASTAGTSQSPSSSGAATSTGPATVTVKNFAFSPSNLTVAKGTKVTWKFEDSVAHNVTANGNKFKSADLKSGQSYSYTFNTPGTYSYICTIHQYMKGTVTVK